MDKVVERVPEAGVTGANVGENPHLAGTPSTGPEIGSPGHTSKNKDSLPVTENPIIPNLPKNVIVEVHGEEVSDLREVVGGFAGIDPEKIYIAIGTSLELFKRLST